MCSSDLKALPPTPRPPRRRTGHVSQRPENIPTALVAALDDAGAQELPKDHGSRLNPPSTETA